jgi:RIO kinase 1
MGMPNDTGIDLTDPNLKRGQLAAAEQAVIVDAFARDVSRVLGTINDGKEATVYLCEGRDGDALHAAKMYRARKFRAFANETDYLDLDRVRDRRLKKAIQKRSRTGKRASQHLWVDREWQVLNRLHAYGASVPRPIAHCAAGILMEYVGSITGPAPMLVHVNLAGAALEAAFAAVVEDVRALLDCELIHGDLSAYNILYDGERPRLIDLPQARDIGDIADPWPAFYRDVDHACQYFLRHGLTMDPLALAMDLWRG